MSQATYLNLPKTFLAAYDICLRSASPDYCRNTVSSSAPTVLNVYLGAYETCRNVMGSETCQNILAPEPTSGLAIAPPLILGFILGAVLFRK